MHVRLCVCVCVGGGALQVTILALDCSESATLRSMYYVSVARRKGHSVTPHLLRGVRVHVFAQTCVCACV